MRVDFSKAEKVDKPEPLPKGVYAMKVIEVEPKVSRAGDEYWRLKLEVQGGQYDGSIVNDNLFFTPKALNRFKLVYKRLTGIELGSGMEDVDDSHLIGKKCDVQVLVDEDVWEGQTFKRNVVAYDGYLKSSPLFEKKADEDDEIQF